MSQALTNATATELLIQKQSIEYELEMAHIRVALRALRESQETQQVEDAGRLTEPVESFEAYLRETSARALFAAINHTPLAG